MLVGYLQRLREAVVWKLEGLPERDQRMPMTATGTNLLGVVKHLAGTESGYFGDVPRRALPRGDAVDGEDAEPNSDMWATADEPPADVLALYARVTAHATQRSPRCRSTHLPGCRGGTRRRRPCSACSCT